ncbi:EAL domain-containing protein [Pseudomonas sp. 1912-s]|uniref:EAL domain-containing protein n=1 Tax=Pseudomonas sp. 1912-s TaxID=3033802 RepID=UPI0023DEDFA4|nr:EAL domain-containing protein [Pseudomonas sp. 1912-s]MDF3202868.1 EAL domain-containing protein [Pseudomonas sp. 1912-s]
MPDADDVLRGLWHREFRAYLQPKFDLRTGKVDAVEVLARWHHPTRGVLGPASFIPLMARKQWLDELLFELLEQGIALQLKLHDQGTLLGLAFNVSLGQLQNSLFIDGLKTRLLRHRLPLSMLTFEITEDGPSDVSGCVEQLNRLSNLGVRLSMDDFGTGYSSLLRLCQSPFHEIKLAGDFTLFLGRPGRYRLVIRHALALAEDLGMSLVVEGIETVEQRDSLLQMGARVGQGFFCAQPMLIDAIEGWMCKTYRDFRAQSRADV